MRKMADDLSSARAALERNNDIAPMLATHRRIRCSWPTDPGDRNALFDGLAVNYLSAVGELDAARGSSRRNAYIRTVAACRACHEQTCGGPLAVIDKLALE
jgi:hypothetical protein